MKPKTKKKYLTIAADETTGSVSFKSEGISLIEILGLLRLYEQKISLQLLTEISQP